MSGQPKSSPRLRLPRLHDRVAIVTGGSSGIGRAIALAYAREGARVVVADLEERFKGALDSDLTTSELIRDDSDCDHTASFVRTDVCSVDSVNNLVAQAAQQHGRLDIIVNAAGIAPEIHNPQPIWSISDSTWMSTMAVNTTGLLYVCRAAISQWSTNLHYLLEIEVGSSTFLVSTDRQVLPVTPHTVHLSMPYLA